MHPPNVPSDGRIDAGWLTRHLRFNFYLNRVAAGDRLPSVRELARTLHVSPNTAVELYKGLENAGFVETRPRSGTFLRRMVHGDDRTARDISVFDTIVRLARRLELLRVPPREFAQLLLRYTGGAPRDDFAFAFIASQERFALLEPQLAKAARWKLPFVTLSPDPRNAPAVRELLARTPSIRCLLSSYAYCEAAFQFAEEFHLQVIIERLDPAAAAAFEPPARGRRIIVTRDSEFAAGIRHVVRFGYGAERARHLHVVALRELRAGERLPDADEIFVSPFAIDEPDLPPAARGKARPLTVEISKETIDDLLFHYLFSPERTNGARTRAGAFSAPVEA
jgi:DNA-binding transcriptional regulator YhcF (GntR family)